MSTIMEALGGNSGETIMEALGGEKGQTIAEVIEKTGLRPISALKPFDPSDGESNATT